MNVHQGNARRLALSAAVAALLTLALVLGVAALGAGLPRWAQTPRPMIAPPWGAIFPAMWQIDFLHENVALLVKRTGPLEARLTVLRGLSERVPHVAGVSLAKLTPAGNKTEVMDDLTGADEAVPAPAGAAEGLGRKWDRFTSRLSIQVDALKLLDAALTLSHANQGVGATALPVNDYPYLSSSFGWRRNPVTHRYAMHEGLDFVASTGTPILAASTGVVVTAGPHGAYGNLVEIDHGAGITSRYAHAQVVTVRPGDVVRRGQVIARVGSTGRSTGAHLHFEVRLNGQALDPRLFLGKPRPVATMVATTSERALARLSSAHSRPPG